MRRIDVFGVLTRATMCGINTVQVELQHGGVPQGFPTCVVWGQLVMLGKSAVKYARRPKSTIENCDEAATRTDEKRTPELARSGHKNWWAGTSSVWQVRTGACST